MPIVRYIVRWPDDVETVCFSPSTVIRDYLDAGRDYAVDEFVARMRAATAMANERVQARYGFVCWSANEELSRIAQRARRFHGQARVSVAVLGPERA